MGNKLKDICVVGLGYIGLPTASLLATKGYRVLGVDIDSMVVDTINRGGIHIVEPGLDVVVKAAINSGNLSASTSPAEADVFVIAVPTPFKNGHVPNIDYVEAATRSIAPSLKEGDLVILESTSPVGTTENMAMWIAEERSDLFPSDDPDNARIYLAHCPERVLPGRIIEELVENDRIVGGLNKAATEIAAAFYREFVSGLVLETDCRTAELAKLAENTFRDINIAYANELSMLCDKLRVDVWQLIKLANHHPRVNILQPGPGVGGHCIAVDPWFIVDSAPDVARLIRTGREVNLAKMQHVLAAVRKAIEETIDPIVACFGLAFKADIDDLRESPAVEIAHALASDGGCKVIAVEPFIEKLPSSLSAAGITLVSPDEALVQANIVVGLVDHSPFRNLNVSALPGKRVIDTRGMWRTT